MELRLPLPEEANHRHAEAVLGQPGIKETWLELIETLQGISDEDLAECHETKFKTTMSLSRAYNYLIKNRLEELGWLNPDGSEPHLFSDSEFSDKAFRLDFAKDSIAVEVSFNHGEALAWNMIKLTLAGELNHVKKEYNSRLGVIILATSDLKKAGCFDGACGEWEKAIRYLAPMQNQLTVPIALLGIERPTFHLIDNGKGENPRSSVIWD